MSELTGILAAPASLTATLLRDRTGDVGDVDQAPENNDPANLAALCQRCHLTHDADHNRRKAHQTRRHGKALGELFDHVRIPR